MHETIPLVDLHWQHAEVEKELLPRLTGLMSKSAFILGETVSEFEAAFAAFSRVRHCVGVASGTARTRAARC